METSAPWQTAADEQVDLRVGVGPMHTAAVGMPATLTTATPIPGQPSQQMPMAHDPALLAGQEHPGSSTPARQGWRGLVNQLGFHLAPSVQEVVRREEVALINTPFNWPMSVMVANPKGGAGKTPTSLLLAAALGRTRGGGVVAWDNNELRGNMALLAQSHGQTATVGELLANLTALEAGAPRFSDLARFLRHQDDGQFDVLASRNTLDASITGADFVRVYRLLCRFAQIIVVDTGNAELAENWQAASLMANQLVVPVKWQRDHCMAAALMLQALQGEASRLLAAGQTQRARSVQQLAAGAVVVATHGPGEPQPKAKAEFEEYFITRSRAVVEIPSDPHISSKAVLEFGALQPATQKAVQHLAALVCQGLNEADKSLPVAPSPTR